MEEEKKFSLFEIIMIMMIVIAMDLFELFSGLMLLVPFIGELFSLVNGFVDFFVIAIVQFWFIMKGERGLLVLAGNILEFIPGIDALPLRSITTAIGLYLANHPETAGVAQMATGKVKTPQSKMLPESKI